MGVGSLITHGPKVGFIKYDSVEDFNFYIYEMCTTLPPSFLHQNSDLEIIFHSPQSEHGISSLGSVRQDDHLGHECHFLSQGL